MYLNATSSKITASVQLSLLHLKLFICLLVSVKRVESDNVY